MFCMPLAGAQRRIRAPLFFALPFADRTGAAPHMIEITGTRPVMTWKCPTAHVLHAPRGSTAQDPRSTVLRPALCRSGKRRASHKRDHRHKAGDDAGNGRTPQTFA